MWPVAVSPRPTFPASPLPKSKIPILPLAASGNNQLTDGEDQDDRSTIKPLSGSDVLSAMQRAAAEKTGAAGRRRRRSGKRKGKPGVSSTGPRRGENDEPEVEAEKGGGVDVKNVRPLCIKSEWIVKLDELEKRLIELSPSPSHVKK